jgi:Na+(H+)/acetate symporter ActP
MFGRTKQHLKEVEMSYWQHFCFAMSLVPYLLFAIAFAIIHAIVPGLFVSTTSSIIKEVDFKLRQSNDQNL